MPFQSEKQRRYLHANHPEIAKRWEKEYAHGGILDITGDEEITTEEGNDISLVDESETGVSTLFMKKGGRVPFQGGGRDASQADFGGSPSGGSAQGGDDKSYQSEPREIGIQQAYEVTGPAAAKVDSDVANINSSEDFVATSWNGVVYRRKNGELQVRDGDDFVTVNRETLLQTLGGLSELEGIKPLEGAEFTPPPVEEEQENNQGLEPYEGPSVR